nr:MAG TPA: hypothetical protein [Caudoviricetes sp.]
MQNLGFPQGTLICNLLLSFRRPPYKYLKIN